MKVNNLSDRRTEFEKLGSSVLDRTADGIRDGGREVLASGDSIALSGLANLVARVLEAEPSAQTAKLGRISAAYRDGTYRVDVMQLSEALISGAFDE